MGGASRGLVRTSLVAIITLSFLGKDLKDLLQEPPGVGVFGKKCTSKLFEGLTVGWHHWRSLVAITTLGFLGKDSL